MPKLTPRRSDGPGTPDEWQQHFAAEIHAERFPLQLPRGRFAALLGLHRALTGHDQQRAADGGQRRWKDA